MDFEELLKAIQERNAEDSEPFGYGISIASRYLKSIAACLGGNISKAFSGISEAVWEAAVKDSQRLLTYCDDSLVATEKATGTEGFKTLLKRIKGGSTKSVPKHCALVFENFVTSSREDRDRDIMESDGGSVDPKMLLLWQHIPVQPIGKMLGMVEQTKNYIKVISCVLDINQVSSDAIKLIEADAMRISHGFKPIKFSPLVNDGDSDNDRPPGFHIRKFEVVEESLVSVPANVDAVITMSSRGKLTSSLVKAWAKTYFDDRPAVSPGIGSGVKVTEVEFQDADKAIDYLTKKSKKKPPKKVEDDSEDDSSEEVDTIECPECGAEIPADSEMCPDCEAEIESEKSTKAKKKKKPGTCPDCGSNLDDNGDCQMCSGGKGCGGPRKRRVKPEDSTDSGKKKCEKCGEMYDSAEKSCPKCSGSGKNKGDEPDFPDMSGEKAYVMLKDSWEWITSQLRSAVKDHLKSSGIQVSANKPGSDSYYYCSIEAMFSDKALIVCEQPNGRKYYWSAWKMSEGGAPKFSGSAKECEIAATIVEKFNADTATPESVSGVLKSAAIAVLGSCCGDLSDLKTLRSLVSAAISEHEAERSRAEQKELEDALVKGFGI